MGSTKDLVVANEVEGGKMALKVLVKCVRVPNCACIRIYTYLRDRQSPKGVIVMENNNNDTPDGEVEFACNTLRCKWRYEFSHKKIDRGRARRGFK